MNQKLKHLEQELQHVRDEYNRALESLKQDLQQARDQYQRAKVLLDEAEAKKNEARDWLWEDVDEFGNKKGCEQRKKIIKTTRGLEPDHLVWYGHWYWASATCGLRTQEVKHTSYEYNTCKYLYGTPDACKGCKYEWRHKHYYECLQNYWNQTTEFENGGYSEKVKKAEYAIQECNNEYLLKIKNAEDTYLKQKWGILFLLVNKIKRNTKL